MTQSLLPTNTDVAAASLFIQLYGPQAVIFGENDAYIGNGVCVQMHAACHIVAPYVYIYFKGGYRCFARFLAASTISV